MCTIFTTGAYLLVVWNMKTNMKSIFKKNVFFVCLFFFLLVIVVLVCIKDGKFFLLSLEKLKILVQRKLLIFDDGFYLISGLLIWVNSDGFFSVLAESRLRIFLRGMVPVYTLWLWRRWSVRRRDRHLQF